MLTDSSKQLEYSVCEYSIDYRAQRSSLAVSIVHVQRGSCSSLYCLGTSDSGGGGTAAYIYPVCLVTCGLMPKVRYISADHSGEIIACDMHCEDDKGAFTPVLL